MARIDENGEMKLTKFNIFVESIWDFYISFFINFLHILIEPIFCDVMVIAQLRLYFFLQNK